MRSGIAMAALALLGGCMDFSSAERQYCLRHLDVCGFESGALAAGAKAYLARPTSAQVPPWGDPQPLLNVAGAQVELVYSPEEQTIGWRADVPEDWMLQLCGRDGVTDLACYGMTGETGAIYLPEEFELPLRRGGVFIKVSTLVSAGSLRGYLYPHDGSLLIAELTGYEREDAAFGQVAQVVVVVRSDATVGVTTHGDFNGQLNYGDGPLGARTTLGTFSEESQTEWFSPFPAFEALVEGSLHLVDSGSGASGQLVPPGSLVLHGQPRGAGLEPATAVARMAAVTVVVTPSRSDALWLVHKDNSATELTHANAPHGQDRTGFTLSPGLFLVPSAYLPDAFDRRLVYVAAQNSNGDRGRAQLLAPGERLFGAALTDGVMTVGDFPAGAQVVHEPGAERYRFDLWTRESISGTASLRDTNGSVYENLQGNTRFSSRGESGALVNALEQERVEVLVSGGASLSGTMRPVR